MISTAETRWFAPGTAPEEVRSWFASRSGTSQRQPIRRDYYLLRISGDGLSVKLREGGLEIKQRYSSHGPVHFGRSMQGIVEQWVKWRFPLDDSTDPVQTILTGQQPWLAIDKERLLKFYQVDGQGLVQTVSKPADVPGTLHIELATVEVRGSRWWTLAFEASGDGREAVQRLVTVTRLQFADTALLQLPVNGSFGYPRWLAYHLKVS